jgi:hypothetical protein
MLLNCIRPKIYLEERIWKFFKFHGCRTYDGCGIIHIMPQTQKEIKKRYFDRKYAEAPIINCACGCGGRLKSLDKYARPVKYLNGHNGRKYDDPRQVKREWNHRNRAARYEYKKQYGRKRKIKLIKLKGGECEDCGVKFNGRNACIFHFHHTDFGKTKDFTLGQQIVNKAWKVILKEVKKCVMVCANCHAMRHNGVDDAI